ncbi:DUF1501 domain-containing protein [Thalassoglobus sp. JC818]|uniref:DUF1501 domain-containing protein n=1 Tax=Thalassoglobus sp. JC818 TaxID=3232136 RepID=UPI003457AADE
MSAFVHESVCLNSGRLNRRRFLRNLSVGALASGLLPLRDVMSLHADELRQRGKSMILIWLAGGPSQLETFDPKPSHENGGGTKAISTSVPGIQIAQDWPKLASVMDDLAIIRSMQNKEGAHQRATYQMHTGYVPSGSVKHPSLGSCIAQQLADHENDLPSFVSIGQTIGAGFLGVDYEPFNVTRPGSMPQNLSLQKSASRYQRRLGLLGELEDEFAARGAEQPVRNHRQLYDKASKLVLSPQSQVFDLTDESKELTAQYGDSDFGRGCLLARRLVESGVSFVEVRSNGWDTHQDNFSTISDKAQEVDPASATLIKDLKQRGMLDDTLVVFAGEFGRTPRVNPRGGRDHFPRAFNVWLAGCGVRGGQTIGATSRDGNEIVDRPVGVHDLFQSICQSLGVDANHENISPLGRPMKVVDGGESVAELFA